MAGAARRLLPALIALLAAALPASAAAAWQAGAASVDFSPPAHGLAGDPSDCAGPLSAIFSGARRFAYEEPYVDRSGAGHFIGGDPYLDCNANGRWDGNFLGGGSGSPRFFDRVLDPVGARAIVVDNGSRTLAVEVVDQEGLFDVYQQRIRDAVAGAGVHLDGIFISATHDESAPDSLGLSGVSAISSSVNPYWADLMVKRSAEAIVRAYRALRPARVSYAEAREPARLRQCWSSYPFIDDRLMPTMRLADLRGRTIATLADVSQHAETLGFNPDPVERLAVSSDWVHFFRARLEQRFGGIAVEMAGSVGSVETPQVFPSAIAGVPQRELDVRHPAGCRTLFEPHGTPLTTGYRRETRSLGLALADAVADALARHAAPSRSTALWGRRSEVCLTLTNQLFLVGGLAGIFAQRPSYLPGCTIAVGPLGTGQTAGTAVRTEVAAFRIGDGEFAAMPGEVFPFTFLRGPVGPGDLPYPGPQLPVWLIAHMHAPYRFIDGLAEDMIGYLFPTANGVGVPGEHGSNALTADGTDRFGCNHSDDSEAASSAAATTVGAAAARLFDSADGVPERIVTGRYVLADGTRSRDPLGDPVLKCKVSPTAAPGPRSAVAVWTPSGGTRRPAAWMSLSGRRQSRPDRDTRGYFDARGERVWLDVYGD